MATPQELQAIIREMNAGLRNLVRDQQTFLQNLVQQQNNANGQRRSNLPGGSPSSGMDANRRLTGSVNNLNKQFKQLTPLMETFARSIRIATRQINRRSNPPPNPPNGNSNALITQIQLLIAQLRNNNPPPNPPPPPPGGGGGGGNNNNNNNLRNQFSEFATSFTNQVLGKLTISAGLEQGYKEVKLAASKNAVYQPTSVDTMMMGMSSEELINLQADNRASTLRATNGIKQWTQTVKESQLGLLPYTGSLKDAAKVTADLQTGLLNLGFSFEQANNIIGQGNGGLIGNLKDLSATTGQTILQLSDRIKGLNSADESKDLMRRMDKAQRMDYINTQAKLLSQYTQLTGTVDRAEEILRAQQKAAKMTAVDRLVGSVKARSAAMGLGMNHRDATRLQQLMAMNPSAVAANAGLTKEMTALKDKAFQLYSKSKGATLSDGLTADLSRENLADKLYEFANLDQFKPMDTSLDTSLIPTSVTEQQSKSLSTVIDQNKILSESLMWLQRIHDGISKSALVMMGIGAIMVGLRARGGLGGLGGGGPLPPGGGPPLPNGIRLMRMLSNPRVIGGIVAAGTLVAGLAVDKLWDPSSQKQEQYKNATSKSLEYAGYGMALGTVIAPVIGTAIGGALGGLAGAIVGLTQVTRQQEQYDVDNNKARVNSDIQLMKVRHENEAKSLQEQIAAEQTRVNNSTGSDVIIHQKRLDLLTEQLKQENELYEVKMKDALTLQKATNDLAAKLQESFNTSSILDQGFGYTLTGKDKFKTESVVEDFKMSPGDIASLVASNTNISSSDFDKLNTQLAKQDDIVDSDLVGYLHEAFTKQSLLQDQQKKDAIALVNSAKNDAITSSSKAIIQKDGSVVTTINPNSGMFNVPNINNTPNATTLHERKFQAAITNSELKEWSGGSDTGSFATTTLPQFKYNSITPDTRISAAAEAVSKNSTLGLIDATESSSNNPADKLDTMIDLLTTQNNMLKDQHQETITQTSVMDNQLRFMDRTKRLLPQSSSNAIVDAFSSYTHPN